MSETMKLEHNTVYDDVFRTMMEKTPRFIIYLINEVFAEKFSGSEQVRLLQNEFLTEDAKIVTDAYFQVGDKYYHIECQSNPDGTMAIRMLEYDFMIALRNAEKNGYEYNLKYPNSCVLYLRHNSKTPDNLVVNLHLPNGKTTDYQIPIIKVKEYDIEEIFEKKLFVFLPYYIMKYESALKEIEQDEEKCDQLLKEFEMIYIKINHYRENKELSYFETAEVVKLMNEILNWVARAESRIKKGVASMGGKLLEFPHDKIYNEALAVGEARGEARGEAQSLVRSVESLMQNTKATLEEACRALGITLEVFMSAKTLIGK